MARFAANTLKAKRAGILLDFNSSYSRGLSDYFRVKLHQTGWPGSKQAIVYRWRSRLSRTIEHAARLAAPDVIFIPGYYEDA